MTMDFATGMEVEFEGRLGALLGGSSACVLEVGTDDGLAQLVVVWFELVAALVVTLDAGTDGSVLPDGLGHRLHALLDVVDAESDDALGTCCRVVDDVFLAWDAGVVHALLAAVGDVMPATAVDAGKRLDAGFEFDFSHDEILVNN